MAELRKRRDLTLTKPTDEELDQLAEVGPADIPEADVEWRQVAPTGFKTILDATEE